MLSAQPARHAVWVSREHREREIDRSQPCHHCSHDEDCNETLHSNAVWRAGRATMVWGITTALADASVHLVYEIRPGAAAPVRLQNAASPHIARDPALNRPLPNWGEGISGGAGGSSWRRGSSACARGARDGRHAPRSTGDRSGRNGRRRVSPARGAPAAAVTVAASALRRACACSSRVRGWCGGSASRYRVRVWRAWAARVYGPFVAMVRRMCASFARQCDPGRFPPEDGVSLC